ncbi:MAG: hypothetical protein QNK33_06105 [Bacteroidales bacterium]|nr:hypothetical protein [Bacteroidales bacterium]
MIRRKIVITFAILFVTVSIQAQIPDDFIRIDASKIDGLSIVKEPSYLESSLFGYMNGGAELYLEYGFDRLVMTEMYYKDNQINTEVYRMKEIPGAFGIYSVSTYGCNKAESLTNFYCQNSYQVQFCKANYYVSIVNHSGSEEGIEIARKIAGLLLSQIEEKDFEICDYIPNEQMPDNPVKIKLVQGKIALGNSAYAYSKYLDGFDKYCLVIAEGDQTAVLAISFDNKEDIQKFFAKPGIEVVSENPLKARTENAIIYLDSGGRIILHIDTN